MNYDYDRKSDVLYISFGKPKEAICVEKENGILFRVNPFSDKLVGITVINAKKILGSLSNTNIETFTQTQLGKY